MSHRAAMFLHWAPRVLAIAFAVFLGVFALDLFHEPRGWWEMALALSIHLIPSAIVVLMLAASWRWEWMGALLFTLTAGLYAWNALPRHLDWAVTMGAPLLAIAGLFLADWILYLRRPRLRTKQ